MGGTGTRARPYRPRSMRQMGASQFWHSSKVAKVASAYAPLDAFFSQPYTRLRWRSRPDRDRPPRFQRAWLF